MEEKGEKPEGFHEDWNEFFSRLKMKILEQKLLGFGLVRVKRQEGLGVGKVIETFEKNFEILETFFSMKNIKSLKLI